MADTIKKLFTESHLSELINFKQIMEADYFLFLRTLLQYDKLDSLYDIWYPRTCLYLDSPPTYLVKAQSKKFLKELAIASGLKSTDVFIERLNQRHSKIEDVFVRGVWKDDPLIYFDLKTLGSRK